MENKNTTISSGRTFRKPGLVAALLLTALSLSACLIAPDRDGGGRRHHQWSNDGDWNGGAGWQGNGGGSWDHHH